MGKKVFLISVLALGMLMVCVQTGFAATIDTDRVTAEVTAGENELEIVEDSVSFGNRAGSLDNHRFVAGPLTVNFFPATSSWYIKIYTDNDLGKTLGGLVGEDGETLLPLRCWIANYGPHPDEKGNYSPRDLDFNVPDPEHDTYWESEDGEYPQVWYWVFDVNATDEDGDPVVRKLIDPAAEILDTFEVCLAIETAGVKPQAYGSIDAHPKYGQVTIKFEVE